MGLIFEDPPGQYRRRSRTDHAAIVKELKARPGQWAIVSTHPSGAAAYIAANRLRCGFPAAYRPAGAFEAVGRSVGGEFRLYVRYVGEDGNAE
jgi:hypothetical protein